MAIPLLHRICVVLVTTQFALADGIVLINFCAFTFTEDVRVKTTPFIQNRSLEIPPHALTKP